MPSKRLIFPACGKPANFEQVTDFRFARAVEHGRGERDSVAEAFGDFEQLIVVELGDGLVNRSSVKTSLNQRRTASARTSLLRRRFKLLPSSLPAQPRCVSRI